MTRHKSKNVSSTTHKRSKPKSDNRRHEKGVAADQVSWLQIVKSEIKRWLVREALTWIFGSLPESIQDWFQELVKRWFA